MCPDLPSRGRRMEFIFRPLLQSPYKVNVVTIGRGAHYTRKNSVVVGNFLTANKAVAVTAVRLLLGKSAQQRRNPT